MTIKSFDRATCRQIAYEAINELRQLGEQLGLQVMSKGGNFDSTSYTMKIEFAVIGESGVAETETRVNFRKMAGMYGLRAEQLDQEFSVNGTLYRVCGLKPRASKYPILATQVSTGKTYKFPANTVVNALGNA